MSELIARDVRGERGRAYACWVSAVSLMRGVGLILRAWPKTLLRALCAVTFDTLYKLRTSRRLPSSKLKTLLLLLDLGACLNRHFDGKGFHRGAYRRLREQLKQAGADALVDEYVRQLKAIERKRPEAGGDERRFHATKTYREAVVRLSLALVTAEVFDHPTLGLGFDVLREDDFELVFRIVLLCQVIDDVLDYKDDYAARLPSFLTATRSRQASAELTRRGVAAYRDTDGLSPSKGAMPFQVALWVVSACASTVLRLSRMSRRA